MSGETVNVGGTSFRIEPLSGPENWMPWKRRMTAIFRELELVELIADTAKAPEARVPSAPTEDEKKAIRAWEKKDEKVRTRIELAIANSEFVHLLGAETARDQWKQLCTVYESRGRLGILAAWRALFRAQANEDFEMKTHIGTLRTMQEQLHAMGSVISDEDFVMILITSLPESWDMYTSAYLGSMGNKPTLKSHEIIAILTEEYNRRRG